MDPMGLEIKDYCGGGGGENWRFLRGRFFGRFLFQGGESENGILQEKCRMEKKEPW